MSDIEMGLEALVEAIKTRNILSVAIPPLGSGLGGLDWPDVRERIEQALGDLAETRIVVFEPKAAQFPFATSRP